MSDDGSSAGSGGHSAFTFLGSIDPDFDNLRRETRDLAEKLNRHGVNPLAHFGPSLMDKNPFRRFDHNLHFSSVWNPITDTGIFNTAGDSCMSGLLEHILDCFQGFTDTDSGLKHLSRRSHSTRGEGIVVTDLPAVEASHLAEFINTAFDSEIDLVHTKSAHRPAGDVVGVDRSASNFNCIDMVGSGGMSCGPFQYFHSHRCICSRVPDDVTFDKGEAAVAVTSHFDFHRQRMAFGMHADRFLTGEGDTHRFFHQKGCQGCVPLNRKILLTAKASAVGHQLHTNHFLGKSQDAADALPILINTLTLGIDFDAIL